MKKITIKTPAKINLSLKIGKLQKNNLHEIKTTIQKISLEDEIEIENLGLIKGNQKIRIIIKGPQKIGVPANADNIAYQAAQLFFKETGIKENIKITITKNIPSRAGLGGGSANAAGTLIALEKLFNKKLKNRTKTAEKIGSDVCFFAENIPSAEVSGTGEKIKKINPINYHCLILMLPKIFISTPWAYKNLPTKKGKSDNDFEEIAFKFFPDLEKIKNELLNLKAKKTGLTGSGSAIFALFDSQEKMQKCASKIKPKISFLFQGKTLLT